MTPDLLEAAVRAGRSFAGQKLFDLDLRGRNLAGADFSRAQIQKTRFEGATLAGARFDGAMVVGFRASGPAVTKTDGFTEPSSAPRHMASMGVAGERRTALAAAAQRAFSRHVAYTA